jgi:hypothetical protein
MKALLFGIGREQGKLREPKFQITTQRKIASYSNPV